MFVVYLMAIKKPSLFKIMMAYEHLKLEGALAG
jgi:hypothetical protein